MTDNSNLLEETARVIEVRDGWLIAETQSRGGCNQCRSDSCTTSLVAKLFGVRRNRLRLANGIGAKPGDRVVIGLSDALLLQAALRIYLPPLLGMLGATAIGDRLGLAAGYLGLSALCGLALGFIFVRWISRGESSHRFRPRLMRIVASSDQRVSISTLVLTGPNQESKQ